jgi:hypothetical protein
LFKKKKHLASGQVKTALTMVYEEIDQSSEQIVDIDKNFFQQYEPLRLSAVTILNLSRNKIKSIPAS